MSRITFNRRPVNVNTPGYNDIKQNYFNHFNWKGINQNRNFLVVDQETFADAKNVYVDDEGLLKSRLPLKYRYKFDNKTLKDVKVFGDVLLVCYVTDDKYHIMIIQNDQIKSIDEVVDVTLPLKAFRNGNKIYFFTNNDIFAYDVDKENIIREVLYPSITRVYTGYKFDGYEDENLFSSKERYEYILGSTSSGLNLTNEVIGKTLEYKHLVDNDTLTHNVVIDEYGEYNNIIHQQIGSISNLSRINVYNQDVPTAFIYDNFIYRLVDNRIERASVSDMIFETIYIDTLNNQNEFVKFKLQPCGCISILYLETMCLIDLNRETKELDYPQISYIHVKYIFDECIIKDKDTLIYMETGVKEEVYQDTYVSYYSIISSNYYAKSSGDALTFNDNILWRHLENFNKEQFLSSVTMIACENKVQTIRLDDIIVDYALVVNLFMVTTDINIIDAIVKTDRYNDSKIYGLNGTFKYDAAYNRHEYEVDYVDPVLDMPKYNPTVVLKEKTLYELEIKLLVITNFELHGPYYIEYGTVVSFNSDTFTLSDTIEYPVTIDPTDITMKYPVGTFYYNGNLYYLDDMLYYYNIKKEKINITTLAGKFIINSFSEFWFYSIGYVLLSNYRSVAQRLLLSVEKNRVYNGVDVLLYGNRIFLSKNENLYIGEIVYDELNNEYLWFKKSYRHTLDNYINGLHQISSNEIAIFTKDDTWYNTLSDGVYYYNRSKIVPTLKNRSELITLSDSTTTLMPSSNGIIALSYQNFVNTTEQSTINLTQDLTGIYSLLNNNIKIINWKNYTMFYEENNNVIIIFDIRYKSWWLWEIPIKTTSLFVYNNQLYLIYDDTIYEFVNDFDEYYDLVNDDEFLIDWYVESQKLHLNANNYYKHIVNLTLASVQEGDEPISMNLNVKNYRKYVDNGKAENFDYEIDVIRTFVKRLNYAKVCEFQYRLSSDDTNAINVPLALSSITIKYKVGGQVR